MALRENLAGVATRLINQHGDPVDIVTYAEVPGSSPPAYVPSIVTVMAVVTGSSEWADNVTILHSDLSVLVSGEEPQADVDNVMRIDGLDYTVIQKRKILAAGFASAIRYFVRRG